MAKFRAYSVTNVLLILSQRPNAGRVAGEIGQHLLDFAGQAVHRGRLAITAPEIDAAQLEFGFVKEEHRLDEFVDGGEARRGALPIELETAGRDVRKPLQLAVRHLQEALGLGSQRLIHLDQEQQVRN